MPCACFQLISRILLLMPISTTQSLISNSNSCRHSSHLPSWLSEIFNVATTTVKNGLPLRGPLSREGVYINVRLPLQLSRSNAVVDSRFGQYLTKLFLSSWSSNRSNAYIAGITISPSLKSLKVVWISSYPETILCQPGYQFDIWEHWVECIIVGIGL